MKRLALVVSLAVLGGCVTAQTQQAQHVQAVLADQAKRNADALLLIDETLAQPLTQDSIFREGDKLSFQVVKPATATAQPATATTPAVPIPTPKIAFTLQIEASCSVPLMSVMYSDSAAGRLYPSVAHGAFGPSSLLPAIHYAKLVQNPSFVQACADKPQPDWRIVKGSGDQQWVLIDAHSVEHRGAEVLFWAAYDEPKILFDLPYNAPFAQKRERYAVDCSRQTYRMVAGYDVNKDNSVTDGRIEPTAAAAPIAGSNDDYEVLFKKACAAPEQLAQLPAFTPRTKVAGELTLPPLSAPALAAVQQLNLPTAPKQLTHLVLSGTMNFRGISSLLNETRTITTDSASGLLLIHEHANNFDSSSLSFRGLFALSTQALYINNTLSNSAIGTLSFSGDWLHMPVGSRLNYAGQSSNYSSMAGDFGKTPWNVACNVVRELPASQVNASLSGQAKELVCASPEDKTARVTHYYYLADYGYFMQFNVEKNLFFYNDLQLKTAE